MDEHDYTASPFQGRLRADEKLLWQGRPVPEAYVRYHVNPYFLAGLGLATCFLAAWELLSLVKLAARLGQEVGLLLLTGLLFGASYNKISHLLSANLHARAVLTYYAVTNRRIMVAVCGPTDLIRNYDELHLSDLCLSLKQLPMGMGNIFFGVTPFHFSLAFRGIGDAQQILKLIDNAQRQQTEAESLRPASYARPDVWDKYRAEGETILRRSKPSVLQSSIFFGMSCGVVVSLIDIIWTDGPGLLAAPYSQPALKTLAIWLSGMFMAGLFWAAAGESQNTFYALTDQRLLRLYRVGKCPRFMEMTLDKAYFLTLEWKLLRLGTISFGTRHPKEFHFRTIWNAPAMLRDIQKAQKDAMTGPKIARLEV